MNLPQDTFILLSYVNTKLRDEYSSLDELCQAENADRHDLEKRLADAGFEYIPSINQFR